MNHTNRLARASVLSIQKHNEFANIHNHTRIIWQLLPINRIIGSISQMFRINLMSVCAYVLCGNISKKLFTGRRIYFQRFQHEIDSSLTKCVYIYIYIYCDQMNTAVLRLFRRTLLVISATSDLNLRWTQIHPRIKFSPLV